MCNINKMSPHTLFNTIHTLMLMDERLYLDKIKATFDLSIHLIYHTYVIVLLLSISVHYL